MSEEVEQVIPLGPNLVLNPTKTYEITYLDENGHFFLSGTYSTPRAALTAFLDFAVSFPAFELRLTEVQRTPLLSTKDEKALARAAAQLAKLPIP